MRGIPEENDEFITVEGSDNSHNNKYGINRSTRWVIKYRRICGNYFFQSIQE
jgi:hypothetical protein